jgi:hypothetical protein
MRKDDLKRKIAWFDNYNETINLKLDEFYSTVPDAGLSEREQYLYDTAQNQFKMLYELLDHSRDFIETEMLLVGDAIETKQTADTHM